jgi:RNA polymerase-binding transcription factor DksA
MSSLTDAQRATIRTALSEERLSLLESVTSLERDDAQLVESQVSGESRPRGEGEGDTLAVERHLVAKLGAQVQTALAEIFAALGRLDDGTYGVCERCASAIPVERLEFRPRTTLCVPCASRRR